MLSLYKKLIKTCRMIPDQSASREMIEWVRADFKKNRHMEDQVGDFSIIRVNVLTDMWQVNSMIF